MVKNVNQRRIPRYRQIYESLANEIRSGRFQAHDHYTTLDMICERFDTSKITAQRALLDLVKSELVYTKRGRGVYIAPAVAKNASRLLGFLFVNLIDDGALPLIINGAETTAREEGYNVLMCNTHGDANIADEHVDRIIEQNVEGILFDIPREERENGPIHAVINRLESAGIPVVLVQKRFLEESEPMACIMTDNYGGTVMSVEHLCKLGHRRIAGIFENSNSNAIERLEGYRGAVLQNGLLYSEDYIKIAVSLDECEGIVVDFLSMENPPTAIVCGHDLFARTVMSEIKKRGLTVPDDIAIVGFDDLPFSKYMSPPLTTVHQPLEEMGRKAMELLIRRIRTGEGAHTQIRLKTELIVRKSSGVIRTGSLMHPISREG